jgi:hypothetical protein
MTEKRAAYPTDLSDVEWEVLASSIPPAKLGGRLAVHERREIAGALAYWLRAGCAWRLLPHDFLYVLWNTSEANYSLQNKDYLGESVGSLRLVPALLVDAIASTSFVASHA